MGTKHDDIGSHVKDVHQRSFTTDGFPSIEVEKIIQPVFASLLKRLVSKVAVV
jgi:hypothetical protein